MTTAARGPSAHRRAIAFGALLLAGTALLTSCAGDGTVAPTPPDATATATPDPDAAATPDPTDEPVEATCRSILLADTVAVFEELGWIDHEEPFEIGSITLDEGLSCKWGDAEGTISNAQIYAWAPISDTRAQTAQNDLLRQGWIREDGAEGVYITDDPDRVMNPDADGYGMTYQFGDGWVTMSDTKEGLSLIQRP